AQTPQTDVFLLGLVLYECLTGRMPWDKETDFDKAVMNAPLPVDGLPPAVQDLIRKSTAKRASERHKTALAFRDAVEDALGPLASPTQLADLLERHFPAQDSPRAARKQVLEAALAAHARACAQTPKDAESPTIPPSQRQLMELEAKPRRWRAALPLVFSFVVASALAVAFWYQTRSATPRPVLYGPTRSSPTAKAAAPTVSANTLASATPP